LRVIGRPWELAMVLGGWGADCGKCEKLTVQGDKAYRALDTPYYEPSEYLCLDCAKKYEIKKTEEIEKLHYTIRDEPVKIVHHVVYFKRKTKKRV